MFSSLFVVLELSGRCAAWICRSSSDLCSELSCQRISLTCVNQFCFLYLLWLPGLTTIVASTLVK